MYFNKIHDPINFSFPSAYTPAKAVLSFGERSLRLALDDLGEDVFRVRIHAELWPHQHSQAVLDAPNASIPSQARLSVGSRGDFELRDAEGVCLLRSVAGQSFGVSGRAWLFHFELPNATQFYGMGEKGVGFERSGLRTKFWNTDVWGDFPMSQVRTGATDPMYANIPWVILKQGNRYAGLLLNNPGAAFLRTPPSLSPPDERRLWLGAPDGLPELFVIVGPSLAALTEKLQRLVGVTPRPPLWALGHQQCRWGYKSQAELDELADQFEKHAIPNDGLWLDIDYMQGFRVFTISEEHWPEPKVAIARLRARGFYVVPILDPGVKLDPGYPVYDGGRRRRVFCLNAEGKPYVGYVWPGKTLFPDFSLPRVRKWWADHVREFAAAGFAGTWIDMNDPSTGAVELGDMLFDEGKLAHESYHNQYATGMAEATRAGLLAANPDERPFVLSRSGFIGSSRHTALWTGDNCSNWYHLKKCIEVSINLALSGIPFNGPDVPGFGDDAEPELAVAWYKVCFLFPFLRNHSQKGVRHQEPWTFGKSSRVIRRYIRLRYKLLPYLYQLFVEQERRGSAILRPLFHDFEDDERLPLGDIADQFLVGPAVLQAPIVAPDSYQRRVCLPAGSWFDARNGAWRRGGRELPVRCAEGETPLYVRAGTLLPMQVGERTNNQNDLSQIELHCFCPSGSTAELDYSFDDGHTQGYANGAESRVQFQASARGTQLHLQARSVGQGFGPLSVRVVLHAPLESLVFDDGSGERSITLRSTKVRLTGEPLSAASSRELTVGAVELPSSSRGRKFARR